MDKLARRRCYICRVEQDADGSHCLWITPDHPDGLLICLVCIAESYVNLEELARACLRNHRLADRGPATRWPLMDHQ